MISKMYDSKRFLEEKESELTARDENKGKDGKKLRRERREKERKSKPNKK